MHAPIIVYGIRLHHCSHSCLGSKTFKQGSSSSRVQQ